MLTDAAIERFSRQILLPEVGGRGQERLSATSVTVRGDDDAAAFATTLLAAAGVQVTGAAGPSGRLAVSLGDATIVGRADGAGTVVATLVGRPCVRCVPEAILAVPSSGVGGAAHAQALGALVAAETLRVALGLASAGRVQVIDLRTGTFETRTVPPSDGCAACAAVPTGA